MVLETSSSTAAPPGRSRLRARAACDECRRRKLRCDGRQPKCGVCQESDTVCEITGRGSRGPKKGYIKALKDRVMQLEAMLENRPGPKSDKSLPHDEAQDEREDSDLEFSTPPLEGLDVVTTDATPSWVSAAFASNSEHGLVVSNGSLDGLNALPGLPCTFQHGLAISEAVHSELDQLYFDRVHTSIPILHQQRYVSWACAQPKNLPQKALQYAMWALATLMSTQFRDLTENIYRETKQMLQDVMLEDGQSYGYETEMAQAWVLLAIFESMRTYHRHAWTSADQAFRLIQGMHFHQIDSSLPNSSPIAATQTAIQIEERRRVFWMAYFLDHLFSMRNDWPVTLNEHVICNRLPSPDPEFQSGHPVPGEFLSDVMIETCPRARSPFNECLIFITICTRILLLNQQQDVFTTYGSSALNLYEQYQWLDEILTNRAGTLSQFYPSPTESFDGLLLFANTLSQTAVVYWCYGLMQRQTSPAGSEHLNYQNRALGAIEKVSSLMRAVSILHFSKTHPLMPLPSFHTAEFLYDNQDDPASGLALQELFNAFGQLKNINNPDQSYLDLLRQSCISRPTGLCHEATRMNL